MKKGQEPEQLDKEAVGRITCRMLQEEGHSDMPLQKLWRLAGMLICLLCLTGGLLQRISQWLWNPIFGPCFFGYF